MDQPVYATASEFYDFIGEDQPTEAGAGGEQVPVEEKSLNARLRRASQSIDSLILTAVYDVDEDGYPTDLDVADALRDATCAQVAFWQETDDVTGAEAQAGVVKIGSVQLGQSQTAAAASKTPEETRRAPEALSILRTAGLLSAITEYH